MQIAILSFFHYFTLMFKKRESVLEVEEGKFLSPKFDKDGLIPVTTSDSSSGELLMHGYMNEEALKKTIETKEAHYWSRSRKEVWHKGKTSGFIQKIKEIRIDDDQDAVWLSVDIGNGSSCHVGYRSCFYRSIPLGKIENAREIKIDDDQDSVWLTVDIGDGASCHVGYRSCFYRSIPLGPIENAREIKMKFTEKEKKFDPEKVYKGQPNPTKI